MCENIKRGDVFYADFDPAIGSEQGGVRPAVVIQNNIGNLHSPTVIVAPITSKLTKSNLPTHVLLPAQTCGLPQDSMVLLEQVRVLDKTRLRERIGTLSTGIDRINRGLTVSFGMNGFGD